MPDIKLTNQSCLDFLPTVNSKSVDLVLLDPPYVISRPTSFVECGPQGVERLRISYDFGEWDYQIFVLDEVMKECHRILKNHGTIICFYDLWKIETLKNWMEGANFKQIRFIEWLKTNPVPINSKVNYLTNTREVAVLGVKGGKPTFNSSYDNGLYQYPINHEKDRFHPNQKPLNLLEALINKHSNEGDTVMDCFAGSSSCAVACFKTNRNFIGCELDENYYQKSLKRIADLTN